MSFPSKEEREKCWASRDELWKCLDDNNGDQSVCAKFRELYVNSCPKQWVKHFDRKREYLKFKDRIQTEGYEPLDSFSRPPNSPKNKSNDKQQQQQESR